MSNEDNGFCTCSLIKENNLNHLNITHFSLHITHCLEQVHSRKDGVWGEAPIKKVARSATPPLLIIHCSLLILKGVVMKKKETAKKALCITAYILINLLLVGITFVINVYGFSFVWYVLLAKDDNSAEQIWMFIRGLWLISASTAGFILLNKVVLKKLAPKGLITSAFVLYFLLCIGACGVFMGLLINNEQ
jgi:hypothetical protein